MSDLLQTLRTLLGKGRVVFHWAGSLTLLTHWRKQKQTKTKKKTQVTSSSWKAVLRFYWPVLSSPCVFASHCCTHWRSSDGGGDELDVTFGEPASLSSLQLTQPPHILLLQHSNDLHTTAKDELNEQVSLWVAQGKENKYYLIFVKVEVVVLLGSPGIQGLGLKTLYLLSLVDSIHVFHFLLNVIGHFDWNCVRLPVQEQERERSLLSLWPVWRLSAAEAVPRGH